MAVAQWIKYLAGEMKDPGSIPGQGEFFSLSFQPNGEQEQQQEQLK